MDFNGMIMKTGHNLIEDNEDNNIFLKNLLVLLGIFIEDATKLSGVYCIHSNRTIVTKRDIELALKTRAYHGDAFWNSPNIISKIKEMQDFLESDPIDYMEDIDDDTESDDDMDEDEEWTKSLCLCSVCNALNSIENKWNWWSPENSLEKSIKNAIDISVL